MKAIFRLVSVFAVSALLALVAGCGGGSSNSSARANVRLVNATTGATLTLNLVSSANSGSTATFGPAAAGGATEYNGVDAGAWSATVVTSDNSLTPFTTASFGFAGDGTYTVLAYQRSGSVGAVNIADSTAAPATGYANLRVFNTSIDAGVLDVYVLATTATLGSGAAPTLGALGAGIVSATTPLPAGSYKLVVTAAGNPSQVRLTIPSITVADQDQMTLALVSTSGGALVDAVSIKQSGSVTTYRNSQARVRAVAALDSKQLVTASAGTSVLLGTGVVSPSIGTYTLVDSGSQPLSVTVNGVAKSSTLSLAAGGDYTVLLYGASASPAITSVADNNQALPSTGSLLNFRVVNGLIGLNGTLALTLNYTQVATSVAAGSASGYGQVTSAAAPLFQLTSSDAAFTGYSATGGSLVSQGVYTMFVLGTPAAPVITIVKDR